MNNNQIKQFFSVIEIPLGFQTSESDKAQEPPASFNNIQYKVKLIRTTAHLKHLLNNPPQHASYYLVDDIQQEQLDNYLWAVGELISGIYDLNQIIENKNN